MKISFDKKILFGFVINLLILIALGWVYFIRTRIDSDHKSDIFLNWLEYSLFALMFILLIVVYFIIRSQVISKNATQKILFENEQFLRSIIDNTTNPISIKKINGEYIMVNRQFEESFQTKKEEIIGKTDQDVFPKELADSIWSTDIDVIRSGKDMKVEEIVPAPDGLHTFLAVKFPLLDTSGKIHAVGSIATDISERKVFENSLKAGDKFFNLSLDVLAIASGDTFIKINPTLSKLLGYPEKDLLKTPYLKFIHPEDIENTQKEILKLQSGMNTIHFINRWISYDGSIKWLSWIASPDKETGLLYAVAHDVTESKIADQQIKETNYFLNTVLENIPNMIFVKDAKELRFLKFNKAGEKLLGYREKDLLGKNDYDFFPKEEADFFTAKDRDVLLKKEYVDIPQEPIETKNGKRWLHTQKIPVMDEQGQPIYLIGISEDITERKKTEESLKVADRFFNMSYDMLVVAKGDYFIKVNAAFTRILGYQQEDMNDRPYLSFSHPDEIEATKKALDILKSTDTVLKFRARGKCKDGTYKILDWTVSSDVKDQMLYGVGRDVTEFAVIEESQKVSDTFFNMSDEMFIVTKGEHFLKINPNFSETLGYSNEEIHSLKFLDLIHVNDRQIASSAIMKMKVGENLVSYHARTLCKDGSYKWIEWSGTADNEKDMIYGVGRDISKQLEDEKSLLVADKFFSMAFEMLIVGNEKYFVRINPAFTRILGYDQKEMNEIMYVDLTHPDDLEMVKSQIDKLLQGEPLVSYKSRIKAKNGDYKWIHFTATSDLQSGLIYVVARDITEEIKLEKEQLEAMNRLYENEEKLHLILENIGDGVIVANTRREILMANYMANELYEVADDSQISFNLTDHFKIFYPDERTVFPSQNLPIERALLGETTEDVDVVLWNPVTQTKRRVLISGRPLIDTENKVVAVVITFKDISKYKQMEAELQETESKYRRIIGFKKDVEESGDTKEE